MAIHDRIKEARIKSGYTQKELGDLIGMAKSTVAGYETGNSEPSIDVLIKIMDALHVDANYLWQDLTSNNSDNFSADELDMIRNIKLLDKDGVNRVKSTIYAEIFRLNQEKELSNEIASLRFENERLRRMFRYTYVHKIASAGHGFYYHDIPTDTIEAPYKEGADFIIGVSGDSMEPTFYDGDKVYVRKTNELDNGQIGIFLYNNECYIKEKGEGCLISHNKKYPDMIPSSDVRLIGEVIGKVEE